MKRLMKLLMASAAAVCLWLPSLAESFTDGSDFTWDYEVVDGTITITGVSYDTGVVGEDPALSIPSEITIDETPVTVTRIGDGAFMEMDIASVYVPSTIYEIGVEAFLDCTGLESVEFATVEPIEREDSDSYYFEASCLSIGQSAFSGCEALTSISLPANLETLGEEAFADCTALESVTFASEGYQGLDLSLSIGESAFSGCEALTGVRIPANACEVGAFAFDGCSSLGEVVFVAEEEYHDFGSYLYVGEYAFANCEALEYVDFQNCPYTDTLEYDEEAGIDVLVGCQCTYRIEIGDGAFSGCTALETLVLGDGVSSIGNNAFSGCEALTEVYIPGTITYVGQEAFDGCTSLEEVYFMSESDFTETMDVNIDSEAFAGCESLRVVEFEDRPYREDYNEETEETTCIYLADIRVGESAFADCTALEELTFGIGVTEIGADAFSGCTALAEVEFPASCYSLDSRAFSGCTSLAIVTFNNSEIDYVEGLVEEDENDTFYGTPYYNRFRPVIDGSYVIGYRGEVPTGAFEIGEDFFPEGVEQIDDSAFEGLMGLRAVYIPAYVASIGNRAFAGCTELEGVYMLAPEMAIDEETGEEYLDGAADLWIGEEAFADCTRLRIVEIEERPLVEYEVDMGEGDPQTEYSCPAAVFILSRAFSGCTALEELFLGNGVASINEEAFVDCSSLTDVRFPFTVDTVGVRAFSGCESLASVSFESHENLKWASLYIEEEAFAYCTSLESVDFWDYPIIEDVWSPPDTICMATTYIGTRAFAGCTALTDLYLGIGVRGIYEEAFYGCTALESVAFQPFFEYLDSRAFADCSSLVSVTFEDEADYVENGDDGDTFYGTPFYDRFRLVIDEDGAVSGYAGVLPTEPFVFDEELLPFGVTEIADGAFEGLEGLTAVYFPASVSYVGERAFADCPDLEEVSFAAPYETWEECLNEETGETESRLVWAGASALDIASEAFAGCTSLAGAFVEDRPVVESEWEDGEGETHYDYYCAGYVSIGESAFAGCSALEELYLGTGISEVGEDAFTDCSALTELVFSATISYVGDRAFVGCEALESVLFETDDYVASSELWIGEEAFHGCESLESVEIVERRFEEVVNDEDECTSVECDHWIVIGTRAFSCCTAITDLWLGMGVAEIDDEAFMGCTALEYVEFPMTLGWIGERAFAYCSRLSEVWFPAENPCSDVVVADDAFFATPYAGGEDEEFELVVEDGVLTEYRGQSFDGEDGVLVIPEGVTEIGEWALEYLDGFTSVTIPSSVTIIGAGAFSGCPDLEEVVFEGDVEGITFGAGAFWNTPYNETLDFALTISDGIVTGFVGTEVPEELVIPYGVTAIGVSAFDFDSYCINLDADSDCEEECEDPESEEEDFYSPVTGIKRVVVAASVRTIDRFAFWGCSGLESVAIGNPGIRIEGSAFYGCTSLEGFEFTTPGAMMESVSVTGYDLWGDGEASPYVGIGETVSLEPSSMSLLFDGFEYALSGGEIIQMPLKKTWITFYWTAIPPEEPDTPDTPAVVTHTLSFDSNGGSAVEAVEIAVGAAYGELPVPVRDGWSFVGWFDADGNAVTAQTVMGEADATLTAKWAEVIVKRRLSFDSNGGSAVDAVEVVVGAAYGELPVPVRDGWSFVGWFDADGNAVTAQTVMGDADATLTAKWEEILYTLTFDTVGGSVIAPITLAPGAAVTAPADPVRDGYVFQGWNEQIPSVMPKGDKTFTAQWGKVANQAVVVDVGAPGEEGGFEMPENVVLVVDEEIGEDNFVAIFSAIEEASVPRHGRRLAGLLDGDKPVDAKTVVTEGMSLAADWDTFNPLFENDEGEVDGSSAQVYDGYILDANGETAGTIQVKVGKPNKKTRLASVSAAVQMIGAKKLTFKGADKGKVEIAEEGATTATLVSGSQTIVVDIAADGLTGAYGDDYEIVGARNATKNSAPSYAAWIDTYTLAFETVEGSAKGAGSAFAYGRSTLTVSVAAKGKVKVSGTMADGSKATASAQLLVAESGNEACVNVVVPLYSKKGGFGFVLWLAKDGTATVESVSAWDATASKTPFTAEVEPLACGSASLKSGSLTFGLVNAPTEVSGLAVATASADGVSLLPDGVVLTVAGNKLTAPKAGKVKTDKAGNIVVTGVNPSALKLSYTAKTGVLKGSFTFYLKNGSKLKKQSVTLTGAIVDGKGYGTATIKKVGSFAFELR